MVVGQSEALAERPDLNFRIMVGNDSGIASAFGKIEKRCNPLDYTFFDYCYWRLVLFYLLKIKIY